MIYSVIFSTVNGSNLVVLCFTTYYNVLFCFCFFSSPQESKKHLAGLGTLGLGSLITEITASEEEDQENRDSGSVDAEGEGKYIMELQCRQKQDGLTIFTMYCLIQVGWKALKMQLIILTLVKSLKMRQRSTVRPWCLCSPAGKQVIILQLPRVILTGWLLDIMTHIFWVFFYEHYYFLSYLRFLYDYVIFRFIMVFICPFQGLQNVIGLLLFILLFMSV